MIGASYRKYSLNSNGTIFADTAGKISVDEYGGYLQLQKKLLEDKLKLTLSGRFDKSQNFDGRFTPDSLLLIKLLRIILFVHQFNKLTDSLLYKTNGLT